MGDFDVRKIIKANKCSNGIPKPDLILYFSVKPGPNNDGAGDTAIITIIPAELSTIYQTISCKLYTDYELKNHIGKYAASTTVYDIKDSDGNNIINANITSTFFLPDGNITIMYGQKIIKNDNGNYLNQPNTTHIYKILSGSQKYLNIKKGFVSITTNDTLTRLVTISF